MTSASSTLAAPTLVWAIAAAVLVAALLGIEFRCAPLFRRRYQRLLALGRTPGQLSTLTVVAFAGMSGLTLYIAVAGGQRMIAAAVAGIGAWGFGWLLSLLIERDERRLRNQLAGFSLAMAGALRAGFSAAQAIERASAEIAAPLAPILIRVHEDYQRGATVTDALNVARERLNLDALNLLASAINVTTRSGGRLDEALERISDSIQDQQRLEDKLHALTASGRSAMIVLGVFPFAFAAFFYSLDPSGYQVLLETPLGRTSVGLAVVTVFLSVRWAKAILDAVG